MGARAGKYKLGARVRFGGQAKGRGPGNTNTRLSCIKDSVSFYLHHQSYKIALVWKAVTDLCAKQIRSPIAFMCSFHLFVCSFHSVMRSFRLVMRSFNLSHALFPFGYMFFSVRYVIILFGYALFSFGYGLF